MSDVWRLAVLILAAASAVHGTPFADRMVFALVFVAGWLAVGRMAIK